MHCIRENHVKETNRIGYIKFKSKEKYFSKLSCLVRIDIQEKMPFQRLNLSWLSLKRANAAVSLTRINYNLPQLNGVSCLFELRSLRYFTDISVDQ